MDDVTRRYAFHLTRYEPFQIVLPAVVRMLQQHYASLLLRETHDPVRKGHSDDFLRGQVAAVGDIIKAFAEIGMEAERDVQARDPAARRAETPEAAEPEQPFARVRID